MNSPASGLISLSAALAGPSKMTWIFAGESPVRSDEQVAASTMIQPAVVMRVLSPVAYVDLLEIGRSKWRLPGTVIVIDLGELRSGSAGGQKKLHHNRSHFRPSHPKRSRDDIRRGDYPETFCPQELQSSFSSTGLFGRQRCLVLTRVTRVEYTVHGTSLGGMLDE